MSPAVGQHSTGGGGGGLAEFATVIWTHLLLQQAGPASATSALIPAHKTGL